MNRLLDWLDHRTGYKSLMHEALYERVPGGARWRYVWGSTLTFTLSVQFITGIFLWMAYSPSAQTAWESVYYIQHEMAGGWFLRGLQMRARPNQPGPKIPRPHHPRPHRLVPSRNT